MVGSPQWSLMDALNRGWLRKSFGASAATTMTSTVPLRRTEPVRAVGVEMHRAAGFEKVDLPVELEPQLALHHVDPFLAAVTSRLRGRPVCADADLQRLQRRGARKPAAGGDGEAVGLVRHPPRRGGRDGRRAPALTEQRAHRHPECPRQGDQGRHRGLAVTRLQAGEMGGGEVGALRQLFECQAGPGALLAQALGEGGKCFVKLHQPIVGRCCLIGKRLCQSSRFRNIGETVPRSAPPPGIPSPARVSDKPRQRSRARSRRGREWRPRIRAEHTGCVNMSETRPFPGRSQECPCSTDSSLLSTTRPPARSPRSFAAALARRSGATVHVPPRQRGALGRRRSP